MDAGGVAYRGTSLIRNTPLPGPYSRTVPRLPWRSWKGGGGSFERGSRDPFASRPQSF